MAINQGKVNRWMQGRKKETNITLKKRKRTEAVALPKNSIITSWGLGYQGEDETAEAPMPNEMKSGSNNSWAIKMIMFINLLIKLRGVRSDATYFAHDCVIGGRRGWHES